MNSVGIIDYDCGNLFSVKHALEHVGGKPSFCKTPEEIMSADRLLLPGVGAFGDAMDKITKRGLPEAILAVAASGRPILGICLGMQLLTTESEELGTYRGLDLIPGKVVKLPTFSQKENQSCKIPNVGWSRLLRPKEVTWDNTILHNVQDGMFTYFVHSFHYDNSHPQYVLASQQYGDITSPAVIARENVVGCQFHPERSAETGLQILRAWLNM